ncbi:MAG TPA: NIPSNAP family protein [bacterium]|nr:NIPSNAP family protein [bacterium]
MIYEFRTYRLKVGSLAEVEKRFAEAYTHRKKYSELAAFWHTEIGPLNQIVHVWPYATMDERLRIRGEAAKDPNWPPKIQEFILGMTSEIVIPFPFSPAIKPGKYGPFYEMRSYLVRAGQMGEVQKRWEPKVPERAKLSPLLIVGQVELGTVSKYIHVWPYPSLDQRGAIRSKAVEIGVWPPGGGAETLAEQENKILVPSAFSPVQ